jgi:hypothetical protein
MGEVLSTREDEFYDYERLKTLGHHQLRNFQVKCKKTKKVFFLKKIFLLPCAEDEMIWAGGEIRRLSAL